VEELREAFGEGFTEIESLKRYTGLGTGFCQGKACLSEVAHELARLRQVPPQEIPLTTIRQPAEPLTFAELASLPVPAGEDTGSPQAATPTTPNETTGTPPGESLPSDPLANAESPPPGDASLPEDAS
jgi:sarcosine oxidase subunit beta